MDSSKHLADLMAQKSEHERERLARMDKDFPMGGMIRYYNREGEEIPFSAWAVLNADRDNYKRIAQEDVLAHDQALWVSTVWIGLDMNMSIMPRRPLVFETMVFEAPGGRHVYTERYSTEAQARDGHAFIVTGLEEGTLNLYAWEDEDAD